MIRITFAVFAFVIGMEAQESNRKTFDLKGDALAESFDQFQQRHSDVGIECSGDPDLLAKHGLTDKYSHADEPSKSVASDSTHNFYCSLKGPKQTLVGAEARSVEYRFFGDKLYEIDIRTYGYGGDAYRDITTAYIDRFGEPRKTATDTYQNGMGAIFHGEHHVWTDAEGGYVLTVTDEPPDHKAVRVQFVDIAAREALNKLRPKKTSDT